jgi:hypothetical protein
MPTPTDAERPGDNPQPATKPKGKRGGRRPGAGAPKGNLNGLKHGLRSRQFAAIGALLAQDPNIRETLLAMGRKHELKHSRAQQVAAALIASLMTRANKIAKGRLDVTVDVDAWRAINKGAVGASPAQVRAALKEIAKSTTQSRSKPAPNNAIENQVQDPLD